MTTDDDTQALQQLHLKMLATVVALGWRVHTNPDMVTMLVHCFVEGRKPPEPFVDIPFNGVTDADDAWQGVMTMLKELLDAAVYKGNVEPCLADIEKAAMHLFNRKF